MKKIFWKVPMFFIIVFATLIVSGLNNLTVFGGLEVNSYDEPFLSELLPFLFYTAVVPLRWAIVITVIYYLSKHLILNFFTFIKRRLT